LLQAEPVQGRITNKQLPKADRCIPGIARYHRELECKPMTFLQLLWKFEGEKLQESKAAAISAKRKRR
jgi:hypothetical protein